MDVDPIHLVPCRLALASFFLRKRILKREREQKKKEFKYLEKVEKRESEWLKKGLQLYLWLGRSGLAVHK